MKCIGKYLQVELRERPKGRKTDVWSVLSTKDVFLGQVSWFGRWRQYTFMPRPGVVFNRDCLIDLVTFLDEVNKQHREKKEK